jgi:uncharacterized membrane protein YgdD (TMEM256/DUF423 family)
MSTSRTFLLLGALSGFFTVAFGAFAAHGLKAILSPGLLQTFHTGVDYQGLHSLALLAVGLLLRMQDATALRTAGWAFASGILVFSGSLYLLALTDARWLGAITPFGGAAFLLGWAALAWGVARPR